MRTEFWKTGALIFTMLFFLATVVFCCETWAAKSVTSKPQAVFDAVDTTFIHKVSVKKAFKADMSVPEGEIALPFYICDHAVLQRNAVNRIAGQLPQGDDSPHVAVAVMQNDTKTTVYFGQASEGRFEVFIGPHAAATGCKIVVVSDKFRRTVNDVCFGDVFLLAGQSNMVMALSTCVDVMEYASKGNTEYRTDMNAASDSDLRLLKYRYGEMEGAATPQPPEMFSGKGSWNWSVDSPESRGGFSCLGYYFLMRMRQLTGIPVGGVLSCVGDSTVPTWVSDAFYPLLPADVIATYEMTEVSRKTRSRLFNRFISPLRDVSFRAIVWMQGEGQPLHFQRQLEVLIECFRSETGRFVPVVFPQFPSSPAGSEPQGWFALRDQQRRAAESIPKGAYSVNLDCGYAYGEQDKAHYGDKKPVGVRSADAFAGKFYGIPEVWRGPLLEGATKDGQTVRLEFGSIGSGLVLRKGSTGFESAGADRVFKPAEAEISGNTVVLQCATEPIHVRYLFGAVLPPATLYNHEGYPGDSFWVVFQPGETKTGIDSWAEANPKFR